MADYKYSGLFRLFPIKGKSEDGFVTHDKDVIRNSLIVLIKTQKGSRVYDPDYGTNLHMLIHELNIQRIRNIAQTEIKRVIEKYEKRAKLLNVDAAVRGDTRQQLVISLEVEYIEFGEKELLEIKMDSDTNWVNEEGVTPDPIQNMVNFANKYKR